MTACNFTSKYRMLKHPNIVAFIGYAMSETELVLVDKSSPVNIWKTEGYHQGKQLMIMFMIMLLKWLPFVK